MTGSDIVKTFDQILELLRTDVMTEANGWSATERVDAALKLTQAVATSVSGR